MTRKQITWVTVALLLANIVSGMDATIITTALPAIVSDLHGIQYMGWIVAVFLLGMAVFSPLWGKLGERTSNKLAFQLGLVLFIVSSAFEGMASNIYYFLLARFFMGIGAGGIGSLPYIIIGEIFPKYYQRAKALGYISASWSTATVLGPLVGGWIVDSLSWHWIFYINIPLGVVTILIVQRFYQTQSNKVTSQFDYAGAVLMTGGLALILLGIQLIGMAPLLWTVILVGLGGVCLLAMKRVERAAVDPIVPGRIFKNKLLLADFILFSLAWGGGIAIANYVPTWAQGLLATTALIGGLTQIPNALSNMGIAQVSPYLQTRYQAGTLIFWGLFATLVSLVVLVVSGFAAPFWVLLIACFFSGLGSGLIFVILQVKVQQDAPPADMAIATSLSYLVRILAQTFMASLYGVIMNVMMFREVQATHGRVTMAMMNKISDVQASRTLPPALVPTMRRILHSGLHAIMVVASLVILLGIGYNWWVSRHYQSQVTEQE